jgi:uncharacterized MAPEG superfamily protein
MHKGKGSACQHHHGENRIMTTELSMLCWSVVLGLVQIAIAATCMVSQRGLRWAASARDGAVPPLTGIGGRLDRARANFLETFPLFLAVVLTAHLLQRHDSMTVLGAQLYFWSRLVYVPLYAAGIAYVRTLAFAVSFVGIVLLLGALF